MIRNGTFNNSNYWVKGTGWSITNGVGTFDNALGISSLSQIKDIMISPIEPNTLYTISFDITVLNGSIYFAIQSTSNQEYIASRIYPSGHYSMEFYAPSNVGSGGLLFYTYALGDFSIDNVSLVKNDPIR